LVSIPTPTPIDELSPAPTIAVRWGWGLCWLMFASTVLNYMDRQAMTLVGPQIKGEFHIRNEDFGWILAAFSLSYALAQVPAGYLADRWNVRWVYAGAVAWWSLAGVASAFSPSLGLLMAFRALLGVGESFNWPCALRVTATVLPPADRGLGNGIFNSGAAVGAVITPLIVPPLTALFGWRPAFVLVGSLGFVWVGVWLTLLGRERAVVFAGRSAAKPVPDDELAAPSSGLSTMAQMAFGVMAALAGLVALTAYWFGPSSVWWGITLLMVGLLLTALALPPQALKGADWAESLGEVVRLRRFWVLAAVSISINVCWHFLVNWLPTYLTEDRGMAYVPGGMVSALPFLAADAGNLGGGAVSRFLARRGMDPARARTWVMLACALLISTGAWVGLIRSNTLTIALLGVMALGTAAFMANYFAFCQEVSSRHTGLIVGILGGLGNLFVAGFLPFAGKVKDVTGGFGPIFVIVGLLPFLGLGTLMWGWGRPAADPKPMRAG
jgi:ACS family hexuronate transporter-like MFS transporter